LTSDRPMRFRRINRSKQAAVYDFHDKNTVAGYFRANTKLIAYCNYLSNIVFAKKKWLAVKAKEKYIGSNYNQTYIFQSMLWGAEPGVMKYLPVPLVRRRWGNEARFELETRLKQDVQMFHSIAEDVFADKKYVRLIDALVIKNDGFSWAVRVKIRDRWRFYFHVFPFLWGYYWAQPLFWLKIVPLLLMPNILLRIMRGSYRKAVKGEQLNAGEFFSS
jgi:hypothetical protein